MAFDAFSLQLGLSGNGSRDQSHGFKQEAIRLLFDAIDAAVDCCC